MDRWRLRLGRHAHLLAPDGREWRLDGLLALLAARLALAGPQPRETLARQLWPDAEPARARANLRQRLLRAKALAGWAWVEGSTSLDLAGPLALQRLQAEPLLPDLTEPGDDGLGLWLERARQDWQAGHAAALQEQLAAAEAAGQGDRALALASEWARHCPQDEAPRRELARLHYLGHDRARALQELDALDAMLRRLHAAAPSPATQALRALVERAAAPWVTAAPAVNPALARPPELIGRAAELARLSRAAVEPGALLMLGEAGMGKSRLLTQALALQPAAVLVKAQAGDADVPHALLSRLLRALLDRRGAGCFEPALLARLGAWLPERATPGAALGARAQHQALCEVLQASQVLTLALDDLQFADAASLDALRELMLEPRLGALRWLLTLRPAEAGPAVQALRTALVAERRLALLPLPALDAPAVAELIGSLGLGLDTAHWAPRLHQHTGGNPFFLLETLKQLDAAPAADTPLPSAANIEALIERRLQALRPAALALARVAAIAGADFDPALASAVTGRPVLDLTDDWQALQAAQVLGERGFAHDLVLAATLKGLPQAIAVHLHAAVAQALEGLAAEPARLATHWLAARQPARALPWLARAADRAHAQLRPLEEAGFLSQWAELIEADPPAQAVAVTVLLRLARVRVEAQGFEAATVPLERALHLAAAGPQRLQALNLLAEIQFNRLMPEASARTAEQALALARELGDHDAAAVAVLRCSRALCMAGRAAQGEALWQAEQGWMAGVRFASAEMVSDRGWVLDRLARVREARAWHARALAQARAAGRPVDEAVVLGNLAQSLLLGGEPAAANAALDRIDALVALHDGLHGASDYVALYRGMAAAALGRFSLALAQFEQALADAEHQSDAAQAAALSHRAMLWAGIGQRSRALADAAQVLAHAALPAWVVARAHHALALASGQGLVSWQRAVDAFGDPAQLALDAPPRLRLWLLDPDPVAALARTRALLRQARGHAGLRWAVHWTAAQLAARAGRHAAALRHARVCLARPAGQAAPLLTEGLWWQGLWQLGAGLAGVPAAQATPLRQIAQAAHAAGQAWLASCLQEHLPGEFRAGFCEAVPAHAALLAPPAP